MNLVNLQDEKYLALLRELTKSNSAKLYSMNRNKLDLKRKSFLLFDALIKFYMQTLHSLPTKRFGPPVYHLQNQRTSRGARLQWKK